MRFVFSDGQFGEEEQPSFGAPDDLAVTGKHHRAGFRPTLRDTEHDLVFPAYCQLNIHFGRVSFGDADVELRKFDREVDAIGIATRD